MNGSTQDRHELWSAFLQRWPLASLAAMTLGDYSNPGTQDSFCYWLEKRTENLGSIWGGSSFKFGVYARKDRSLQPDERGKRYSPDFGWMEKYGDTPEEAFEKVRAEIFKVAQAANEGRLDVVDAADLGEAVKWKLAFLYQDRAHPCVVPIFKAEYLRAVMGSAEKRVSVLHAQSMGEAKSLDVLEHGDLVWRQVQDLLRTALTVDMAREHFDTSPNFCPVKDPTKKMAGYETRGGRQLALALDNTSVTIYLGEGEWLGRVRQYVQKVVRYAGDDSRSSNLEANAPQLRKGNVIVKVVVPTSEALFKLCDAYDERDGGYAMPNNAAENLNLLASPPLNQILFGPPGTGKTYATIDETLRVIDPVFWDQHRDDRLALKAEFDRRVEAGDVRFVTFHQSFSYEDFVEGLRAETDADGKLRYAVADGVFKRMCDLASSRLVQQDAKPIDLGGRRIWKMSLGNTLGADAYIYDECIEKGYALLGYGDRVDFSGCKSRQDVHECFVAAGYELARSAYAVTAVSTFALNIQRGDLVVVTDGNYKFRAIGEFVGDYEHIERDDPEEGYGQCRKVRWLRVYEPSLPHDALMNNAFSQTTLYQLHKHAIDHDKLTRLLGSADAKAGGNAGAGGSAAKVLIIDEINRGNISRIFGELITLIEPSKRAGQTEAVKVTLPYSKTPFSVPANLYLICTMNTADRSLAALDIALRRRFSFKEMPPRPALLDGTVIDGTQIDVGRMLRVMNQRIAVLLDRDHRIGHAYFMSLQEPGKNTIENLAGIFRQNIIPLLQEYFFEDWERIRWVLNDHEKEEQERGCCFIVRDGALDLVSLFGSAKVGHSRGAWRLEPSALGRAASYEGIGRAEPCEDEAAA